MNFINKFIAITIALFYNICVLNAQTTCTVDSLMTRIGKWKKRPDVDMTSVPNLQQFITRIDKISAMFHVAYPEPRGTEPAWYRKTLGSPLVPGAPPPYAFSSLIQYWYCGADGKPSLSIETANWGYVFINQLSGFLSFRQDMLKVLVDEKEVYMLPNPKGEWNGYPLYDFSNVSDGERSILIIRKDKLPWKAITQQQYLMGLKRDWQQQMKKSAEGFTAMVEDQRKTIKEWQDNKEIPAASKEEIITSLKKNIEEIEKNQKPQLEKINQHWNDKIAVIDLYMKEHATELQKPAFIERSPDMFDNFIGSFADPQKGGQALVILNENYFDKSMPNYVPQLLVLCWRWQEDIPGRFWKKRFEENFPVKELAAMMFK